MMLFGRILARVAALAMACPAIAQTAPATPDIVVTGSVEKPSAWKRADVDHVTVYSAGSADELTRVTQTIERLHTLMARIYLRGASADETLPLQVTLIDSTARFRTLYPDAPSTGDGARFDRFDAPSRYDPGKTAPRWSSYAPTRASI